MKTNRAYVAVFVFISLLATVASAQWVQITGGYGDDVLSVAQRDSLVIAGTNSGLYISHNAGANWTPSTLSVRSVQAILITDTRVIAGTEIGVFISTDSGATWWYGGLTPNFVISLCRLGTLIFAGTDHGGVLVSTDSGTTWDTTALTGGSVYSLVSFGSQVLATVNLGNQWNNIYATADSGKIWTTPDSALYIDGLDPLLVDGSRIYAGGYGGVYESVDSARTWSESSANGFPGNVTCLAKSGGNLIAGTDFNGVKYSTDGGSTWRSTGLNSDQWTFSSSYIFTLADSGSTLFAGTLSTGIFRSTDNGVTWSGYGLTNSAVKSLFSHGNFLFQTNSGGVFRCSDYGNTWVPADNGFNWPAVSGLAANDSGLYASVPTDHGGLYRSTDNGDSWTKLFPNRQFYCVAANDSIILAGGPAGATYHGGLFISTDGGKNWTMAIDRGQSGMNSVAIGDTNLFATDLNNQGIFVSTDRGQTFSSQDSGSCMALIGRTIYVAAFYNSPGFLSRDNGRTWAQESSPGNVYAMTVTHDTIFAATDHGIFASADSGITWGDVAISLEFISFHSIAVLGGFILAGSSQGTIWRAPLSEISIVPLISPTLLGPANNSTINTDSVTCSWAKVPEATDYRIQVAYDSSFQDVQFDNFTYTNNFYRLTGLDNGATCYWRVSAYQSHYPGPWSIVRSFHVATDTLHQGRTWSLTGYLASGVSALTSNDSVIIAGTMDGGIFRSTDDGETWIHSSTGLTSDRVASLAADSTNIFAGTASESGGVFRSTDEGRTWSLTGLNHREVGALAVSDKIALAGVLPNMLGTTYTGGLFISTNDGLSWTQSINSGQSWTSSVVVSDSVIFATDESGAEIFISTDNGGSWTSQSVFTFGGRSIAVIGQDVYVGALVRFGGYRSTDEGKSWTYVGSDGPNLVVTALLAEDNILFAAYPLYFSRDAGLTWTESDLGLKDNDYITSLTAKDNYLFAGSNNGQVWKVSIPAIITAVRENRTSVPSKFALAQNYPDPFNPATTISFDLNERSVVRLEIYNLLGQKVVVRNLGLESAGTYQEKLDMSRYASGVYIYRIVAVGVDGHTFIATKKMVFLNSGE